MSARFQYKFKCDDLFYTRLATLNIEFQHSAKYRYIYFSKSQYLMSNEFIRIIDGVNESIIDYKFRDDVYMPWNKIKSKIDSVCNMKQILLKMGMNEILDFDKKISKNKFDDIDVDIIEINEIYIFVEIKFTDLDYIKAEKIIKQLGFCPNHADLRSSVEIALANQNVDKL